MEASAMQSVLGGLMNFPDKTVSAYSKLIPECFIDDRYRAIFQACLQLHKEGKEITPLVVFEAMDEEYHQALALCCNAMPTVGGFDAYVEIVRENWRKHRLYQALSEITLDCLSAGTRMPHIIAALERALNVQIQIQKAIDDETAKSFIDSAVEFIIDLDVQNSGMKTGWSDFDYMTGGLQRKAVYVIAARSGHGKTDLAINLAMRLSKNHRVTYNSMEMPRIQLMRRVVARATRINASRLRDKESLTQEEKTNIAVAVDLLSKHTKLVLDEQQGVDSVAIEAKIQKHSPDVFFIDHLGLMNHDKAKRNQWEAIGETTRALKRLALKHNVAIVELVQLNRTADTRRGDPIMSELKGSSDIENDADGIFTIRVKEHSGILTGTACAEADVFMIKNRHGSTGKLQFSWYPQYSLWVPIDTMREAEYDH